MLPVSDFKLYANRKNKPNLVGKIKVKLLVVFAVICATLFATQLVFASNLATDGQKVSDIDNRIKTLESENTMLKVEIAKESSLSSLSQKAQSMGYTAPKNILIP